MLSAAVSGQIFASPNAGQVEKALDKLKGGKGTLVIVSLRMQTRSRAIRN